MVENWIKDACSETRAAFNARSEVEVELGALKENQSKLAEQLKEAIRRGTALKQALRLLISKLKIYVNSCTILKSIWQHKSN